MGKRPAVLVGLMILLGVAVTAVTRWHAFDPVAKDVLEPTSSVRPVAEPAQPTTPSVTDEPVTEPEAPQVEAAIEERPLSSIIEGIDPLLRDSNLIVQSSAGGGLSLETVEQRFQSEVDDSAWSDAMEGRIVSELSQLGDLKLAALETECRATVCRLKLFYPSGTSAVSVLGRLKRLGAALGFDDVVEAATVEANGVPASLLYLVARR